MQLGRDVEDRTEESKVEATECERANDDAGYQLAQDRRELQVALEDLATEFGGDKY